MVLIYQVSKSGVWIYWDWKKFIFNTTNSGADNIDLATFVAFEENFIGPSGLSFSINTSGNLIMTVY